MHREMSMNIMFFLSPKSETVYETLNANLQHVLERMNHHRLTAIPVIDQEGRYIGTMTEGDVLRVIQENPTTSYDKVAKLKVSQIPRRSDHKSVRVDETLDSIVDLTLRQNFVPVVDDEGTYIGIVKRADIIEYLYESKINKPVRAL